MISELANLIISSSNSNRKMTPSGWVSFNAICCHHRGHKPDTRKRGGVNQSSEGLAYSCFNCGFKAVFFAGSTLSQKFIQLLRWANVEEKTILRFIMASKELVFEGKKDSQRKILAYDEVKLPKGFKTLLQHAEAGEKSEEFTRVVEYALSRGLSIEDDRLGWSNDSSWKNRLLLPFEYHGRNVGYTGRAVLENMNPKYLSNQPEGYVYGLDTQDVSWKYTLVMEGSLDAILVNGTSILGSDLNQAKINKLNNLPTEKIFVPDIDQKGERMIEPVLELGWKVSIPPWPVKDVAAAVNRYGQLNTVRIIMNYGTNKPTLARLRRIKAYGH